MSNIDRKPRKNEIVAQRIRDYIVEHGLRPGDRLPTEDDFATLFDVSRVSVREATRGLAMLGVLESAPRRGLTVGMVDIERITEHIGFHLPMGDYSCEQLTDTRVVIETGVLEHVSRRMQSDPSVHADLSKLNDQMTAAADPQAWIRGDREFHVGLIAAAELGVMTAFGKLVHLFIDRFRACPPRTAWALSAGEHQRILDLLQQGEVEEARVLLQRHIEQDTAAEYSPDGPAHATVGGNRTYGFLVDAPGPQDVRAEQRP